MLFGHRKGAFTGAIRDQKGYIEGANGGTLFLDEITEMPVSMQARLLRTVQEREIVRVGDTRPIPVDVRVLSATNRDPQDAVSNGKLREDLYYRLNEFSLLLPPLRERPDDILPLTRLFIEQTARRENAAPATLTPEAGDMLRAASWPGNIRELRSTVRGAFYLAENDGDGRRITPEVLALTPSFLEQEVSPSSASAGDAVPSSSAENEVILSILSRKNVSELRQIFREAQYRAAAHMLETAEGDRPRAAKLLGVSPSSFAAFIRRGEISNSRDPVLAENRCDDPLPSTRDVIPFVRPQRR
jgi:transcriptional regulator with PAS, ATPase and Fis domain